MDLMSAAGSSQTLLLGLVAVGALVVLAGAGMALTRRRFPLTALTAFPLCLCIAGAMAAGSSADSAIATLGSMPASDVVTSAFESLTVSLKIDYAARWFMAFLLADHRQGGGGLPQRLVGPGEQLAYRRPDAGWAGAFAYGNSRILQSRPHPTDGRCRD